MNVTGSIQIVLGTKAQYIKMAPLLRLMEEKGVDHRLIDTGQHAAFSANLRPLLGLREPDVLLGGVQDVSRLRQGLVWGARELARVGSRRRLRREVFGGHLGVCVVHGDTASTLLGAVLARRAGLRVAHVESGLRSHDLLHPFPEELIRTVVPRLSYLLFPPSEEAVRELRRMGGVRGHIVETPGNTVIESLRHVAAGDGPVADDGPVLLQLHRQENLRHRERLEGFVDLALRLAREHPVRFVLHGATRATLLKRGLLDRLEEGGVELGLLLPRHEDFIELLLSARFVVADGATLQEEVAALGIPMLLWRDRTERSDGIGRNVVVSNYDPAIVGSFLADPQRFRLPLEALDARPSEVILETLLDAVDGP